MGQKEGEEGGRGGRGRGKVPEERTWLRHGKEGVDRRKERDRERGYRLRGKGDIRRNRKRGAE